MNLLKRWIQTIGRHPWPGALFALCLIGLVAGARVALRRAEGTLTEPIKKGEIVEAVYGIGTVTAARSRAIKPGIIGSLTDLYVKEGDFVKKGTPLLKIDTAVYTAPFNGVINYAPFKVGENVFPQLPALVITDLNDRYLVVTLEQQGALRVRPSQKAKLSFDSLREKTFDGLVKAVYSYNGNFLARIDLAGLPPEVLPDMTADVAIVIRELKDVLLIPTVAYDKGNVWVKHAHSLPTKLPVELGVVDGTMGQVVSGDLKPGDRLVIKGKLGT